MTTSYYLGAARGAVGVIFCKETLHRYRRAAIGSKPTVAINQVRFADFPNTNAEALEMCTLELIARPCKTR